MNNVINVNIGCINIKAKQRIFAEIWGKKMNNFCLSSSN